jgi:Fe-S oxidoreductase
MALQDYKSTMLGCTRCSYCKFITFANVKSWRFANGCPSIASKGFHSYSGGGRLNAALSLLEGRCNYSEKFKEIAYQCQLCGVCDITCKLCRYDMDVLDTLRELRFKLVEDGQVLPQHTSVIDSLHKEDNMLMKFKNEGGKWAQGLPVKNLSKEPGKVVFHAGCQLNFNKELQKVARTVITVLSNAGVDIGIMGQGEHCCGGRAYDMGYRTEFMQSAKNNIRDWATAGVETVVTSCSDCYFTFKRLYSKEAGANFEVLHTVEFIDRLIREGKIKMTKEIPLTVTYHDPCHLGRLGEPYVPWNGKVTKMYGNIVKHDPPKPRYNGAWGIYEPPRNILKAIPGMKLIEMERNRENAWCCGAGGGVKEAYPDFAKWTASERIEEAKSTGAEAIVTACPWCERNLADTNPGSGRKMKVYDIIELVQQAL